MNYSFHIVRYLPDRLTELMLLYITYIRPFARMLYSQRKKNVPDLGYLFCSNSSLDKCWNGDILSDILQTESMARFNARLNLWSARHILIAIRHYQGSCQGNHGPFCKRQPGLEGCADEQSRFQYFLMAGTTSAVNQRRNLWH